jgi:flagellar hook assembly protein FlgD
LRKTAVFLALLLVATLGIAVPSVAGATGDPKVVIIVGATHGATAGYRADADVAYAEAIKYTSNVVKVYSPYATWAKVKAAVVGASLVIYMGHGNGWPSPYTYDPLYTTKDGFGLNATSGAGDYNNKYYGEPYVSTLDLAPGAIVLLNHLCYASGNSEPGNAEPTVTVARQRADNYAAGFLKAGASAVIADGHSGAEGYIRRLFTTHQSIEDMWRTMPNTNGNIVSFASARTHGATVYQDPSTPTSGFYRALTVATAGTTTDEVVSGGYGDTGIDPTNLVVPGNAAVSTDHAGLYAAPDTTAAPTATLPTGTRLRVVDTSGQATAEGTPLVEVKGIDDPTIGGFMAATDLAARDSTAPVVRVLDPGGSFSPNGDGQRDSATMQGRFTESVAWTLRVRDAAGTNLFQKTGTGSTFSVPWNGIIGGAPVADGPYAVTVTGIDAWHNAPASATRTLTVDTVAPKLTGLTAGADVNQWFSPNGDGVRDSVALSATNSEAGSLDARVYDAHDTLVRNWTIANGSGATPLTWNGRTNAGAYAPDGAYVIRVRPHDAAGNTGATVTRAVTVIGALRSVMSSKTLFFPQDKDALAPSTKLSFALNRPMKATWTLRNAAGQTVITRLSDSQRAVGTQYWIFNGRRADGTMLPRGRYESFVSATDGTLTATQSTWFEMEAFAIKPSDTTPARGQSIAVTVVSAEPLAKAPMLYVYQPGVAAWSVRMTKVGTNTYRSTIRMKTGGGAGPVTFKVWGRDTKGGAQASTKVYTLH